MAQMNKRKQSRSFEDSEVANLIQVIVQSEMVLGRWTKDEHQRFVEALSIHGKNWKKVEEYVSTRSGAQIRSHAQKFFNRLEKEFNKQFNGLKSSEIKQIFENKMFHHYSESEQPQKRARTGSINDISEDDMQINQESMQVESNQQQQQQQQQIKTQLQQGILDLNLHDAQPHEQVTKYQQQQNKIQKKIQAITDIDQCPDDLIKEICELSKEKDQIMAIQQIQNAYLSINEQDEVPRQQDSPTFGNSRPANDESFYHFIMAKIKKFLNNKKPNLSDLIEVPKQITQQDEEVEVSRSRKQSFTFYNDQDEDNEIRYQNLKKVKKE